MSSSRQFTYYEFRLYISLASSAIIAILSILNLHQIIDSLRDFSKSGLTPEKYKETNNVDVKKFEQEFIVFFALTVFSLAIFVLVFSQFFRVIDGVFYQNLYNRFTLLLIITVLIGLTCYSTSVYKNVSTNVTGSPIMTINIALLIIFFLIFFYCMYQFFRTTENVTIEDSSMYNYSEEKNNDSFLSFLFPPKQSQFEKLQKQRRQLQQKERIEDLKSQIREKRSNIEMKKRNSIEPNSKSLKPDYEQDGIQMTKL